MPQSVSTVLWIGQHYWPINWRMSWSRVERSAEGRRPSEDYGDRKAFIRVPGWQLAEISFCKCILPFMFWNKIFYAIWVHILIRNKVYRKKQFYNGGLKWNQLNIENSIDEFTYYTDFLIESWKISLIITSIWAGELLCVIFMLKLYFKCLGFFFSFHLIQTSRHKTWINHQDIKKKPVTH